jgi:hypothetical protein
MWKCRNCGLERARRVRTDCKYGGEHDWIDREEYYADPEITQRDAERARLEAEREARRRAELDAERAQWNAEREAERTRREAEREAERTRPIREYQSFLNSAEGKEQHAKIAGGYMARRRRASLLSLIFGLISIAAIPVGCVAFTRLIKSGEIVSLPLFVMAISFSFPIHFYRFLKKRSKVIPQVRSRETGRAVPIMDAVKFLASRDISRNYEYKDENGNICVPEPFVPDTSNTEAEWQQKMEHAGKLGRKKKWLEAAREYTKIGNECGLLTISAPAWAMAALCYDMLSDGRTLACYKNAVLGYKKLVNQGHEGAQERLAEAERDLAKFLNRNTQEGNT